MPMRGPPESGYELHGCSVAGTPLPPPPPPPLYSTLKLAVVDMMIATMMAKMPSAEAKISMTRILTNSAPFWASASAHPLPQIPTHTPQARLPIPQQTPAYAGKYRRCAWRSDGGEFAVRVCGVPRTSSSPHSWRWCSPRPASHE